MTASASGYFLASTRLISFHTAGKSPGITTAAGSAGLTVLVAPVFESSAFIAWAEPPSAACAIN